MAFVNMHIFSLTFLHFDMSLLLLTVTLRRVSNKHCLLPLLVCVRPGRKPECWFSHDAAHFSMTRGTTLVVVNFFLCLKLLFFHFFFFVAMFDLVHNVETIFLLP